MDEKAEVLLRRLTTVEALLEESEARMRTLIEAIPVGLFVVSDIGMIEAANPQCLVLFNCQFMDLAGQMLQSIFRVFPEKASKEDLMVQAARAIEVNALRPDNSEFAAEILARPVSWAEGQRFLIVVQDITQRRQLEASRQEFVAMVTHDLRSPLTAIELYFDMLAKGVFGVLPDRALTSMKPIERSTQRLLNMVNDLLDFQKIEDGKQDLNIETVAVSSLIQRSIESVETFALRMGVGLVGCDCKVEIKADGDRLVRVMINLISNAIKFTPKSGTVTVKAELHDDWVEIKVIDQGRGIPTMQLKEIFEKYKQVQRSDGKDNKGTGLGLPICKAIVESHGGRIDVVSEIGIGSTFSVWLAVNGPNDCPNSRE